MRAFSGFRIKRHCSVMISDDSIGYGKPQPGSAAVPFGGKERVGDALDQFLGNSHALIRDFDHDPFRRIVFSCGDADFPSFIR